MRRKEAWRAEIAGRPVAVGQRVAIPISLENDPARPVLVTLPKSKVDALVRQLIKEQFAGN